MLKKLECYDVRGIPNKWLASYCSNRKKFISLNGYISFLADIECKVLQGAIPKAFILNAFTHISDLNLQSCVKYFLKN